MTIGIVAVMQGNVFSAVITGIIWLGFGFSSTLMWLKSLPKLPERLTLFRNLPVQLEYLVSSLGITSLAGSFISLCCTRSNKNVHNCSCFCLLLIVYFFFRKYRKAWQLAAGQLKNTLLKRSSLETDGRSW